MTTRTWNDRLRGIAYGGDYYPDQWDARTRAEDVELMRRAGVNIVGLGVFSWADVEPQPGRYDFSGIDAAMDALGAAEIGVALATMTASPPPWFSRAHPESLPVRADGTVLHQGSRQHWCPSSPAYREHAARLVEQVARRYGDHPALAVWHIGNEFGCHVSGRCYCDVSAAAFRTWLERRYGDVDRLNAAWSTNFWSQRYGSFDEILPPRTTPTFSNPAHETDFAEFSSDELLACYLAEKDVLRRVTPDVPVTTNFIPVSRRVDPVTWAAHEDVVSYDSYPDPADPDAHVRAAFGYDLMRSLRGGQPWILMEQAPGAVNWRPHNAPKPPGVMRLWSWQAVAQGADAVMFFQWRQSRGGAEKFHSAMVPHAGADSPGFRDVTALGAELAKVAEVVGARTTAEVAIVFDQRNAWALERDAHPAVLDLDEILHRHHKPFVDAGIACDVVPPDADLSPYRLVVVPNLYSVTADAAARLATYARNGGNVLMSYFSGIVDEHDRVHLGGYPGPFRELLGLRVDEFRPLAAGDRIDTRFADGTASGTEWSEQIVLEGATAIATFDDPDLPGTPAVTRHDLGAGTAWYVATCLDEAAMADVVRSATTAAGVRPLVPDLPPGVQVTLRATATDRYLFALNHSTEPVELRLPEPGSSLLHDTAVTSLALPPRGVDVVRLGR